MRNSLLILIFVYLVQNVFSQNDSFSYNSTSGQNASCSNNLGDTELCFSETDMLPTTLEEPLSTVNTNSSTISTTEPATLTANLTTLLPNANPTNRTKVETTTQSVEVSSLPFGTTVGMNELQPISDDICTCDLTVNLCDINCCCDLDCTEADRFVFSRCFHKAVYPVDSHYCYRTHFIYHNNTEFKMVWSQNGMFCILQNNLPAHTQYHNREPITTLREFNRLQYSKKSYSWPSSEVEEFQFEATHLHRAGEIVWVLRNSALMPLLLPTKVVGGLCQATKTVEYLHDWHGSCLQTVATFAECKHMESLSAASYHQNLTVVSTSKAFNLTLPSFAAEHCSTGNCVPVKVLLCSGAESGTEILHQCALSSDFPTPSFDTDSSTCHNVVSRVRYALHHNGTQGIINATAYITLSHLKLNSMLQFVQSFDVEFLWASAKQMPLKRSGRPGYIVGKPVLAGRKVIQISKEENTIPKEAIELSFDSNRWLSLPAVDPSGACSFKSRRSVTFGENRRSICQLSLNKSNFVSTANCALLQNQILALLVGDAIGNGSESKHFNLYVATFGDAVVEKTGDWVQVMLESLSSPAPKSEIKRGNRALICRGLVTSMHMDVVFAHIGSLANPQAKILGVAFHLGPLQDLVFNCELLQCASAGNDTTQNFPLLSSVSFVDVTKPATTHFAEPPVYEVKLPHDFFYPFFSTSTVQTSSVHLIVGGIAFTRCFTWR